MAFNEILSRQSLPTALKVSGTFPRVSIELLKGVPISLPF